MKKFMSFILLLVMTVTISTTTFAETVSTGEQNIDVQAKYQDNTNNSTVYSVDISWGAMQFTYTESGDMVWNPADHTYKDSTAAEWNSNGNTVTVVNHSNADVTATFSFDVLDEYNTVNGSFDVASEKLAAGVVNGYESAAKVIAALTLKGTLSEKITDFVKIGTIKVVIS